MNWKTIKGFLQMNRTAAISILFYKRTPLDYLDRWSTAVFSGKERIWFWGIVTLFVLRWRRMWTNPPWLLEDNCWTFPGILYETNLWMVWKEGLELTGHMLYENDLGYQTRVCGAAMPQYKYIHRPGIDLLGEQTKSILQWSSAQVWRISMGKAYNFWNLWMYRMGLWVWWSKMAWRLAICNGNWQALSASCAVFYFGLQKKRLSTGVQLSNYLVGLQ